MDDCISDFNRGATSLPLPFKTSPKVALRIICLKRFIKPTEIHGKKKRKCRNAQNVNRNKYLVVLLRAQSITSPIAGMLLKPEPSRGARIAQPDPAPPSIV